MRRILESGAGRLSELSRDQADHRRQETNERREKTAADQKNRVLEGVDPTVDPTEALIHTPAELTDPIAQVVKSPVRMSGEIVQARIGPGGSH
jgi:hypothetical protein